MSDANYSGPLNDWLAQAPSAPAPAPQSWGKSLAGLLGPYLGIRPANDEAAPRPMTMAHPDVIGNRPDVQAAVKGAAEPFGQLGRVMTGTSQDTLGDIVGAAAGLAPIGPPGLKNVVGEVAGPTFSAAVRAVDAAKMNKAVPEAWLGYLRNQPGVKQAELEHIGIEPWLKAQAGPVTKQDVGEFVRSKQPQITEVRKGSAGPEYSQALQEVQRAYDQFHATARGTPEADAALERFNAATEAADALKPGRSKYESYQLPGGTNYGETLLTLPQKERPPAFMDFGDYAKKTRSEFPNENFTDAELRQSYEQDKTIHDKMEAPDSSYKSSHWDDPNVLLHARHNDRTIPGPNGEPLSSLHLEELQSDWHQQGRKYGYKGDQQQLTTRPETTGQWGQGVHEAVDQAGNVVGRGYSPEEALQAVHKMPSVPDAPFKQSWPDLGLKHMLHRAATEKNPNGSYKYHAMSWTPGEAQAERYDLSKQVDSIGVKPEGEHRHVVVNAKSGVHASGLVDENGKIIQGYDAFRDAIGKPLSDVIGKEMAEKILKTEGEKQFEGGDLKVGGEGMKRFYDTMLPNKADALVKKYGAKTQTVQVDTGAGQIPDNARYLFQEEGRNGTFRVRTTEGQTVQSGMTREAAMAEMRRLNGGDRKEMEPVHMIRFTPELRAAAAKGFPLFGAIGTAAIPATSGSLLHGNDSGG